MAIKITIIGLGQVGASIGMALAKHKENILCVGHDKDISIEREAQKKGAVEKTEHNLPSAVRDAKVVVLSLPISEVQKTLEFIAPDLAEGAVVVDTSPVKSEVAKWAKELLPEGRHYAGILPAIGGTFLRDDGTGLDSARADLFERSIFLVSAPAGASGDAVQTASDLVRLLDAVPMLTDIPESDGLATNAYLLPQLISAALLNITVNQPGWTDVRKVADRPYFAVTTASGFEDPDSLHTLTLHNKTNVLRSLDTFIAALQNLRDEIEDEDPSYLQKSLQTARKGRENWLGERLFSDWSDVQKPQVEYSSFSERLFGFLSGKKPKKKE